MSRVPFTILTGFLGAGKTTALNRVLGNPGGVRIAVLVNELGRIAIDGKLILDAGAGDVLELAGGCLCCKVDVKNDLWDGIADIIRRSKPDHVVLETTGIAEPPSIIEGLDRYDVAELVSPAGVVCVVDAPVAPQTLAEREEARVQLEHADRIMLTKLDIATPEQVAASHRAVAAINDGAERASFPRTAEGSRGLAGWMLERRPLRRPGSKRRPHSHRHGQLTAASFVDPEPLSAEPLVALLEELAPGLLRAKGFIHVAGDDRRGYLELAGGRVSLSRGEPWGDDARRSELVVIGEGVSDETLRRQMWGCRAADARSPSR